jgi:ribosomal protein L23
MREYRDIIIKPVVTEKSMNLLVITNTLHCRQKGQQNRNQERH